MEGDELWMRTYFAALTGRIAAKLPVLGHYGESPAKGLDGFAADLADEITRDRKERTARKPEPAAEPPCDHNCIWTRNPDVAGNSHDYSCSNCGAYMSAEDLRAAEARDKERAKKAAAKPAPRWSRVNETPRSYEALVLMVTGQAACYGRPCKNRSGVAAIGYFDGSNYFAGGGASSIQFCDVVGWVYAHEVLPA